MDPIVAIRCRITLDSEESATINIVTGVGENRDVCVGLVEKYQDRRLADRVFDLAWTHSQVRITSYNVCYTKLLRPLNFIQIRLLRQYRNLPDPECEEGEELLKSIFLTINGIAAGLKNTG